MLTPVISDHPVAGPDGADDHQTLPEWSTAKHKLADGHDNSVILTLSIGAVFHVGTPTGLVEVKMLPSLSATVQRIARQVDAFITFVGLILSFDQELEDVGFVEERTLPFASVPTHKLTEAQPMPAILVDPSIPTFDQAVLTRLVGFVEYSSLPLTDPHHNVELENYSNGELTSLTRAYGTSSAETWNYQYDATSLGTTLVTDPNNHTTGATYDTNGNLLTATDALNNTTSYTYNSFNEPLTTTDRKGIVTTYTYDTNGNQLTKAVSAAGQESGPPGWTSSNVDGTTSITAESCPSSVYRLRLFDKSRWRWCNQQQIQRHEGC